MSAPREELERLYSREPDGVLLKALSQGSEGHTPEAWAVITVEAARRGLRTPVSGVPAATVSSEQLAPSFAYSIGLTPGRFAIWVGALAWLRQVLHYVTILSPRMPPGPAPLPWSWPLVRVLAWQSLWGVVALAAGFFATRSPYAKVGQVLMVISLGLIIAESLHYVHVAH